jgi:hypothetical protein
MLYWINFIACSIESWRREILPIETLQSDILVFKMEEKINNFHFFNPLLPKYMAIVFYGRTAPLAVNIWLVYGLA